MADIDTVVSWRGRTVVDQNGDKIGKFEEIYLDESQSPEWASVTTGLFGMRQTLIPLRDAQEDDDVLRVPYDKDHVKDAPNVDPDEQLTPGEESALYRHYGMEGSEGEAPGDDDARGEATQPAAAQPAPAAPPEAAAAEEADRRPDAAAAAPGGEAPPEPRAETRGAEPGAAGADAGRADTAAQEESAPDRATEGDREIPLDTEVGPRERVRLKKYVVTDEVTKTVPIEREEVRVEREPFDSPGRGHEETGAAEPTETPEPARGDETPPGNR